MRKLCMGVILGVVVSIASLSFADVIGDFEGSLEPGWVLGFDPVTGGTTTDWSSLGSSSVAVTPNTPGYAWALQFNNITAVEQLASTHLLQFDVYWDSSEWTDDGADGWVRWDNASLNSDAPGGGWTQTSDANITDPANPAFPGSWDPNTWGPTHSRTLTYDFTGLGFDPTGATWAQFNIGVNMGNIEGAGNFYVDNVRTVLIPEPGTLALLGLGAVVLGLRRRRRQV